MLNHPRNNKEKMEMAVNFLNELYVKNALNITKLREDYGEPLNMEYKPEEIFITETADEEYKLNVVLKSI